MRWCLGWGRATLVACLVMLGGASLVPGAAAAATAKAPAWKLLGAVGPTHLPPTQSEVQRVTVGAEGGTFTLAHKGGEGEGTPVKREGYLSYASGSTTATIENGTFEAGEKVTGAGIAAQTLIVACSSDCTTPGSTVTLSKATVSAETNQKVTILAKELAGVIGEFHVGDELSAPFLPAGTTVTSVGASTLGISASPIIALKMKLTATEVTAPIAYDASAGTVQADVEAMAVLGAGSVTVTGGPGGSAETPYFLTFGGQFVEENVEELSANGSALLGEGSYIHVFTIVPGGPGTGEIEVYPANIGGAASSGAVTLEVGPLPVGLVTAGTVSALGWSCPGGAGETTVTCTTTESAPALAWSSPIKIPVEVQTANGLTSAVSMQISEVGGDSASYELPLVVSAQPAEAGIQTYWSGEFEANGEPSSQAGAHPFSQLTAFQLNTVRSGSGQIVPAGDLRDVSVGLPAGLVGDPLVTERCQQSNIFCGGARKDLGKFTGDIHTEAFLKFIVTNAVPPYGSAAEFGADAISALQTLNASIRSEGDFGIDVSGLNSATTWEKIYGVLTVFEGEPAGTPGTAFFSNPTDCAQEQAEHEESRGPNIPIRANSWQQPEAFSDASAPQPVMTGCDKLHFEPEFTFQPTSTQGTSGVGATAHLHIDQSGLTDPTKLATPDLEKSVVSLPEGFTINPAQATGLGACTEAQVGYLGEGALPNPTRFNEAPVTCPDASKLGTVEIVTPLLEEPMDGTVYLAAQEENPFHSLIALYLVVESERFGITLKLPGKVETNPTTGQVKAVFDYVPQQPVEDLTINFRGGGPRSEFATPEVCGTYSTTAQWTPWSAPESGPPATTSDPFTVSSNCASSLSTRPFAPAFQAGTTDNQAGQSSTFVVNLTRKDGEQTLGTVATTLPPGVTGMVSKVAECPEAQANAGTCPASSQIGHVSSLAGVGASPLSLPEAGRREDPVYFTGPYKGAPFGLSIVVHPEAGPFNLEEGHPIVVRATLNVNPHTAQVSEASGPIPAILRGIPLDVRGVTVTLDKPGFMVNPTSCNPTSVTGTIASTEGAQAAVSSRFQAAGCGALALQPKFTASTQAKTSRRKGASLSVKIAYPKGSMGKQANLAYAKVELPGAMPSRLSTLQKACTEAQFAANPAGCPSESVVGHAIVHTPVLPVPLVGPAYFVSHGGAKFPELVMVLQGYGVTVQLNGETFIKKGVTSSTFKSTPDVPFESFELTLPEGRYSALAANGNLCHKKLAMPTRLIGQNGKLRERQTRIEVKGCGKKITVLSKKLKGRTLKLRVAVPTAGKLKATGKGLSKATKRASGREALTLEMHVSQKAAAAVRRAKHVEGRKARARAEAKAKATIKLTFKPAKGKRLKAHLKARV